MVRVFGLLVAAIALMAPANAALITYDFNGSLAPTPPVGTGITAGNFNLGTAGGTTDATKLTTASSAGTFNFFEITVSGPDPVSVSEIAVRHARGASPSPTMTVSYSINGGGLVYVADFNPAASFQNFSTNDNLIPFAPVLLNAGDVFRVQFDYEGSVPVLLDWAKLEGGTVPEPASMAIFGLMGAGLAVRRFRRK